MNFDSHDGKTCEFRNEKSYYFQRNILDENEMHLLFLNFLCYFGVLCPPKLTTKLKIPLVIDILVLYPYVTIALCYCNFLSISGFGCGISERVKGAPILFIV